MKPRIAITADARSVESPTYLATYRHALEMAGAQPVLLYGIVEPERIEAALEEFDGLLLPGGDDVDPAEYGGRAHPSVSIAPPEYDALELEAARIAKRRDLPTLAICRGMQVMNVALGGTLWEDLPDQYQPASGTRLRHRQTPDHGRQEPTHPVDLLSGSRIAQVVGGATIATNSMHHQALRRVAYDLLPVGKTRDGIVEAIEARTNHPFFVGVQWHPEEMVAADGPSRALFSELVRQAAKRGTRRNASLA